MQKVAHPAHTAVTQKEAQHRRLLPVLTLLSGLAYVALALLSRQFTYDTPAQQRPVLLVLVLLAVLFACYAAAIHSAIRRPQRPGLVAGIWLGAVAFRLILIPSWPILEIDIYRYLWDGAVGLQKVSPYAYSPLEVREASQRSSRARAAVPADLGRLVELRAADEGLATILDRVHFPHLPSPYPPVSQVVFAAAVATMPGPSGESRGLSADETTRRIHRQIVHMKTALVVFDLATLALVCWLLRLTGRHIGWSIAYGWCPLVLKEFANSGHLDSIAVFFTTLSLAAAVWTLQQCAPGHHNARWALAGTVLTASALALGIGSKLYPLVLVPLLAVTAVRRLGWHSVVAGATVMVTVSTLVLRPLLPFGESRPGESPSNPANRPPAVELPLPPEDPDALTHDRASHFAWDGVYDVPPPPGRAQPTRSTDGIMAFLSRWEMNDLVFMAVVENLRSQTEVDPGRRAWFGIFSEPLSRHITGPLTRRLNALLGHEGTSENALSERSVAFLLTRGLTMTVWLMLALAIAWRVTRADPIDVRDWLRAAFLSIAWFWLLSPTQNPWYWCWALPLLCFARQQAWLALAPLTMLYYTRFWFAYHLPASKVLGTPYEGEYFFHFVIVWLEFGPWFAWLAAEHACRYFRSRSRVPSRHGDP